MRSVVIVIVIGVIVSAPALACSIIGPEAHTLDPESTDSVSPSAPALGVAAITRGRGTRWNGMSTSCDDLGLLSLPVSADDDVSAAESLGFRAEVVDGTLPEGLQIAASDVWRARDGGLVWVWIDGATNKQEPFEFTLGVTAIDEGGNESPRSDLVIADGGHGGCDVAGGGFGASALGALGLLWRRRVRAAGAGPTR